MKLFLKIIFLEIVLLINSAYGLLQGILMQGSACFPTKTPVGCNTSMADSFTPENPLFGFNKPNTQVYLFTPKNPDVAVPLHKCGGDLPSDSGYDPTADTVVFIHGWLDGVCRTAWMREMKVQQFLRGSYNVILVDWTWGNTPDYFLASTNCKIVGEQIGFIINNIKRRTKVGSEKFHVIGHSLGAIAAGYIGRKTGLRRITALDPALAPFTYSPPEERLSYKDAKIVDVIHSNGGECFITGIGDSRPMGHADFYPNGGSVQISCYIDVLISFLKGDILYATVSILPQFCSHVQSLQFYKVSINPDGEEFIGTESDSYENFKNGINGEGRAIMGMNYEKNHQPGERKKYYLDTTLTCPYVK